MPGWAAVWQVGAEPEADVGLADELPPEPQVPVRTDWRSLVPEYGGVIHEG